MIGKAIVIACLLTSCTFHRQNAERYYYKRAVLIVDKAVPETVQKKCGYNFYSEPEIVRIEQPKDRNGAYFKRWNLILYSPQKMETIIHESIHHINNGVSASCRGEMAAYFADRIYWLEEENERLRAQIRR